VHVLGGVAAVVQQKRRRNNVELTPDQRLIRNLANGWIFAVDKVVFASPAIEQDVKQQAIAAVACLGLDFGAVDVIVDKDATKAYVLEVNTAPGLSSPTVLAAYIAYFRGEHDRA
jgi:D-alanine-D-alanine ligase-like ATP-grasp enzyme